MQITGNNKETSFSRAYYRKEVHLFPKEQVQDKKEKGNKKCGERIVIQKFNKQLAPTLPHPPEHIHTIYTNA